MSASKEINKPDNMQEQKEDKEPEAQASGATAAPKPVKIVKPENINKEYADPELHRLRCEKKRNELRKKKAKQQAK